jgi:hypothetical protein
MQTAVIDIEYNALPDQITLSERYGQALALVRIADRPVGQVYLPLLHGKIDGANLRSQINQALGQPACERWIHAAIGLHEPAPSAMDISIGVCTRDRPDDLRRCLESLAALPDDGQELLVVDNAPSDERTRELVAAFPRVRYLREDRPGLSAARNLAMREARGAIVAFADDAVVVDRRWLRALACGFDDPLVACVTGLTMPREIETEAQLAYERWMSPGRSFKRREFYNYWCDPLRADEIGSGNNMAIRRSAWQQIGPFSTAFGVGSQVGSGEAGLWFSQALTWGYRIVYEPAALIWQRYRATMAEIIAVARGYGMGHSAQALHQLIAWNEGRALGSMVRILLTYALPRLIDGSDRQQGAIPASMMAAWLRGCFEGPGAYLAARRQIRQQGGEL